MILKELKIFGLRCYPQLVVFPMHSLTVLIGENDSGKTSVVRALQLMLTNSNITTEDFHKSEDSVISNYIEIEASFTLNNDQECGGLSILVENTRKIKIKKIFSHQDNRPITSVYGYVYDDSRLNSYSSLSAVDVKALATELGMTPLSTKASNIEIIEEELSRKMYPKSLAWREITFPEIEPYLPIYEPILSTAYKDPSGLIQSSIQSSIQERIRKVENSDHPLHNTAKELETWVEQEIKNELEAMPEFVKDSLPKIKGVKASSRVDLTRLISISDVSLDVGRGYHVLSNYGEGTRKKLWMSLLEWRQKSQDESQLVRPIIRVYDEPDLNLDYAAEKKLFEYISASSRTENTKVQNILCTHSVTLIDRAPAEAVNLVKVNTDGSRTIIHLNSQNDQNVEVGIRNFFRNVGNQLQIRNTEIFYEKGFLVFEGETEGELLPLIYKTLFGRSLAEDSIVPINLHTCGNWKTTLEFLGANRMGRTVMLLDRDATFPESTVLISERVLRDIGFTDGMFFIGNKEIEDAFSDEVIAEAIQARFPREDSSIWTPEHIRSVREDTTRQKPKFSEDLKECVRRNTERRLRSEVRKVDIGKALGNACTSEQVPHEIVIALEAIRTRAGID